MGQDGQIEVFGVWKSGCVLIGSKESISFRPETDSTPLELVRDVRKQRVQQLNPFQLLDIAERTAFDLFMCQCQFIARLAGESILPLLRRVDININVRVR